MYTAEALLAAIPLLALPSIAIAQVISTQPDGQIVPFSTLPQCAALCGPLFNVQGGCVPPVTSTVDDSCFCSSAVLKPFLQGTAEVASICGPQSCQDAPSLQAIETWYEGFCNEKGATTPSQTTQTTSGTKTTSTSTSTSTSTKGSSGSSSDNQGQPVNQTWWSGHWKWVIMLIVMVIAIVGGWIGAALWRKRYLRNKERGIEMRPPGSWGPPPHTPGVPGAFGYGNDGTGHRDSFYNKEATIGMTPADSTGGPRESRGWLPGSRT